MSLPQDITTGTNVPKPLVPGVKKGFLDYCEKGRLAGYPITGVRMILADGAHHEVDSSEKAFYTAAQGCFREYFKQAGPKLLEPIMNVEIECPEDFQGTVVGDVIRRRGIMTSNDIVESVSVIKAEVPLAETFGYATDLRSLTQGQGTFTMELATYRQVPSNIQEEIIEEKKKQQLVGAK